MWGDVICCMSKQQLTLYHLGVLPAAIPKWSQNRQKFLRNSIYVVEGGRHINKRDCGCGGCLPESALGIVSTFISPFVIISVIILR